MCNLNVGQAEFEERGAACSKFTNINIGGPGGIRAAASAAKDDSLSERVTCYIY